MEGKRTIHVVGIGIIGEPLIACLLKAQGLLQLDEVTFDPVAASVHDLDVVQRLIQRGAKLVTDTERSPLFTALGMQPTYDTWHALKQATVIIDCSPDDLSRPHPREWYIDLPGVQGAVTLGQAEGFGVCYVRGINDDTLNPQDDRLIHVARRSVHTLAVLLDALALQGSPSDNLIEAHFVCVCRPAHPDHKGVQVGMREARETWHLFRSRGLDLDLFVWKLQLSTPDGPLVCFRLLLRHAVTRDEIVAKLAANPNVTLARETRDGLGHACHEGVERLGATPRDTAISVSSLSVQDGRELMGICRNPQVDSVLRSSFAAAVWRLEPSAYAERISWLETSLGLADIKNRGPADQA